MSTSPPSLTTGSMLPKLRCCPRGMYVQQTKAARTETNRCSGHGIELKETQYGQEEGGKEVADIVLEGGRTEDVRHLLCFQRKSKEKITSVDRPEDDLDILRKKDAVSAEELCRFCPGQGLQRGARRAMGCLPSVLALLTPTLGQSQISADTRHPADA